MRRLALLVAVVVLCVPAAASAQSGSIVFADDFARSDGPVANGWLVDTSCFAISSGQVAVSCGSDSFLVHDVGISDYYASFDVANYPGYPQAARMVFRYVDANNYWMLSAQQDNIYLFKRVAGSYTVVDTYAVSPLVNGSFAVLLNGSSIAVYYFGSALGTYTDNTFASSSLVGFGSVGTGSRFDNFQARALVTYTPTVSPTAAPTSTPTATPALVAVTPTSTPAVSPTPRSCIQIDSTGYTIQIPSDIYDGWYAEVVGPSDGHIRFFQGIFPDYDVLYYGQVVHMPAANTYYDSDSYNFSNDPARDEDYHAEVTMRFCPTLSGFATPTPTATLAPTMIIVVPTPTATPAPTPTPDATLSEIASMQRSQFVWTLFIGSLIAGVLVLSFFRIRV